MNFIIIKGRLTRDPELRQTPNGNSVCNISVAVDRSYSKDGEKQTDFFDCTFWKGGAEFVSHYFYKGQEILVSGEMRSRRYSDKDGNNRIAWEIGNANAEFCGSKRDNASSNSEAPVLAEMPSADDDGELPW